MSSEQFDILSYFQATPAKPVAPDPQFVTANRRESIIHDDDDDNTDVAKSEIDEYDMNLPDLNANTAHNCKPGRRKKGHWRAQKYKASPWCSDRK